MLGKLKLTKGQFNYFAMFHKTLAEGILLGSLAAFFLPETLQGGKSIPFIRFLVFFFLGLFFLVFGAILKKKGVAND